MNRTSPLVLALLAAAALAGAGVPPSPDVEEARALVAKLQSALQTELMAALKEGGPSRAVEVCRERAPRIAEQVSKDGGWSVGRTSLKNRSPRNAPDAWERSALERLTARAAAGEDLGTMEASEVVETGGRRVFRYVKAIRTGEPCLSCHGEAVAPELAEKLKRLYPEDRAIGYRLGDLRGAFTLSKPMSGGSAEDR